MDELLPCPCCKAPCEVEVEPARSVICEDENGDHYTEHHTATKTYRYRATPPAPVEQDVERAISNADIKRLWLSYGGDQHGPHVEQYYIDEPSFYEFARELITLTPARAEGFKLLVDLHDALVLTSEFNDASVSDFIRLSSEFGRASKFLHSHQYDGESDHA